MKRHPNFNHYPTRSTPRQTEVSAVQIAELALKLSTLEDFSAPDYQERFRKKFGFAFEILVNADFQLQAVCLNPPAEPQPNSRPA